MIPDIHSRDQLIADLHKLSQNPLDDAAISKLQKEIVAFATEHFTDHQQYETISTLTANLKSNVADKKNCCEKLIKLIKTVQSALEILSERSSLTHKSAAAIATVEAAHGDEDINDLMTEIHNFIDTSLQQSDQLKKEIENNTISPEQKLKLLEQLALSDPGWVNENIKKISIKDEGERIRIFKLVALRIDAASFASAIENYNLSTNSLTALFEEILKQEEEQYKEGIFTFRQLMDTIQSYSLNPAVHFALARALLSQTYMWKELWNIDKFIIPNEDDRYAILTGMASAQHHAEFNASLPFHIKDFNISEERRGALAKIVAQRDGFKISETIHFYKIKDADLRFMIMNIAIKQNPARTTDIVSNFINGMGSKIFEYTCPNKLEELKDRLMLLCEDEESHKEGVMKWLIFNYSLVKVGLKPLQAVEKGLLLIIQIYELHEPTLRNRLMQCFNNTPQLKTADSLKNFSLLIAMILEPLHNNWGLAPDDFTKILNVFETKTYADGRKKEIALRSLFILIDCNKLTALEKGTLLKRIFEIEQINEKEKAASLKPDVNKQLQLLAGVISFDQVDLLRFNKTQPAAEMSQKDPTIAMVTSLQPSLNLEKIMLQAFVNIFGLANIENFSTKYADKFGSARDLQALGIYSAQVLSLREPKAFLVLKDFVTSILEGKYPSWRYQMATNIHLKTVMANNPKLLSEWQKGEKSTLEDVMASTKEEDAKKNAVEIDEVQKILRKNLIEAAAINVKEFAELVDCLKNPNLFQAKQKELNDQLRKIKLKQGAKVEDPQMRMGFLLKLQIDFMLLLNPTKTLAEKIARIDVIKSLLKGLYPAEIQFMKDVEALQERLNTLAQSSKLNGYTVEDTDHWEDMLLIGTEVAGSCQRVTGNLEQNKCLLGYLSDGKIRAIVVKDTTGRIVGRRIMRILWDWNAQKPILFKDRLYTAPEVSPLVAQAINTMFIKRAKKLELQLLQELATGTAVHYSSAISALGSSSPYEYVDALIIPGTPNSGVTNGYYVIPANKLMVVDLQ